MKYIFVLLLISTIISCKGKQDPEKFNAAQVEYELVKNWPEQEQELNLGQPTGIGVDTNDNLFVFHRAGRIWT